ncbi:MAG: DUF2199 domain-containing protein [Myxococcales bacterium]|nr:DUF2199 domain-containing protein [Myxococcales bacterium]
MRWQCALCGEAHDELPTVFGAEAPWRLLVPEAEFAQRVKLDDSVCVVDDEHFFMRGQIHLPIHAHDEPFIWSVWCSVSTDSFHRMIRTWDDPDRVKEPPVFGWLHTSLPLYEPDTLHLKTMLHEREPGVVPRVEVEPTDHPLAVEQRQGISMARVEEMAHILLGHPHTS